MNIGKSIVLTLSTFFYVGYLPLIPGTFGSLAGLLIFSLIRYNSFNVRIFTLILTIMGFAVCGQAEKILNRKDSPYIVIDEVSGMLISLAFLPYDIKLVVIAFVLFRIFDSLKPFPIGKLQNLKGGLGIMGDDIVAGLYTSAVIQIALKLTSFNTS
jgi:phosphatidylglycerophosphatase A